MNVQEPGQLEALWQRLLLSRPGEPVETLVQTTWLQGPALYVDLRQPPAIGARVEASCLAELTPDEARILAGQEGFAGRLVVNGQEAEWLRRIDFQPLAPLGDRGLLVSEGDLLIEHGIEADYCEYWQRAPEPADAPCGGALFESVKDGRAVILVRHGRHFGYARDRGMALALGQDLAALLCDAAATEAQALVDCEIALGTITADGWRIDRSTLPWREGALLLGPDVRFDGGMLCVAEMDPQGRHVARTLALREIEGTLAFGDVSPSGRAISAATVSGPDFREIPVIDIAALGSGDSSTEAAVAARLRDAASQVGFLHVTGHGIAEPVIERMQAAAKAFFALPVDRKLASYIGNSRNHRGYVPVGEEVFAHGSKDLKEAFDLALDLPVERVPRDHPMLGPNQWPDLPGFREDVMAYYAAAFAVGRRLLRGLALALGQPGDAFDHLVVTPPSQLRLIHYPYQAEIEDVEGIGSHTDYECFTLLLATAPGLEVMNRAGEWIDAPPVPGALVVNIGDMMEFWSGGAFVATSHRVRKVAQERWSFPLFFAVDYHVELAPIGMRGTTAPIRTGEHLFAQTAQTFRYLKDRAARGELALPAQTRPLATFGREVRHSNTSLA